MVDKKDRDQVMWGATKGKLTRAFAAILLLMVALTMGACGLMESFTTVDIGIVEVGGLNEANVRFGTLNSTKRWHEHLEQGQALELDFAAQLDKGSLTLQVVSPEEAVIWELNVAAGESKANTIEVVANDAGRYSIVVVGHKAGGSYQLKWQRR